MLLPLMIVRPRHAWSSLRFMKTWAVDATRQLVHIGPQPMEVFSRYIQEGIDAKEAGGILLDHVRGPHLEIIEATEPTFWDRRSTHRYHSVAKLRWAESNGMIRYIGEWHTHPQAYLRPSSTDVHEWQVLATDRTDGRALLALIVGFEDLYLETVSGGRRGMRQKRNGVNRIHTSGGAAVDALCGADILYFFLWISWSEYCVTESV